MVVVGRIAGAYGVKGWLRVTSYTDPPENILGYEPWHFQRGDDWRAANVEATRRHQEGFLCAVAGVRDRQAATALTGMLVGVCEDTLPAAKSGEYYWRDLIGLEVVTIEGERFGRVEKLIETGANDVLVVRDSVRIRLVPFIEQVVREIDTDKATIVVDWDPEF